MRSLFSFPLVLVLVPVLFSGPGCISSHVVRTKAAAHWRYDRQEGRDQRVSGEPGYYALLPVTIVADVVTSPFQLMYLSQPAGGHAVIKGVPVPLP